MLGYSIRLLALVAAGLFTGPVLAHTGHSSHFALTSGLLHPLLGADHLLAILAVGLWAGTDGRRGALLWPTAFLAAMALGALLALAGQALPFAEHAIAGSLVVLGIAVALGLAPPVVAGMLVCGGLAVAHGYAHATEIPAGAQATDYVAGLLIATAVLLALSVALARALSARPALPQGVGALVAVVGALSFG
jgi:urease accessory protein